MQREREGARRSTTLWRSFGHAWNGLVDAANGQRNMRIHLVAGVLVGSFAATVRVEAMERAILVLCIGLVLAAEALNTALEAAVDLHGGQPSERARVAKDAAAGAVLLLAAASVAVFALTAAGHWGELVRGWRGLLPSGVGAGALAAIVWRLASSNRPKRSRVAALATAGGLLVALLAERADCWGCVAVPAGLLALSAAVARLPGGESHP
jgi:diacylglycerol kinase (ATP)